MGDLLDIPDWSRARVHYGPAKPNPNRKSAILKLEKIRHSESGQNPPILKQDKKHVRVWLCILFPGGSPSPSSPWNDAVTILIFGANIIISFFYFRTNHVEATT